MMKSHGFVTFGSGVWMQPILNKAEQNYEIYDKEMLVIMTALDEWYHHLLGAKLQFEIWTDHQNLTYFKK